MPFKPECKKIPDEWLSVSQAVLQWAGRHITPGNLWVSWLKVARTESESKVQQGTREPDFSNVISLGHVSTYAHTHTN